MKKDELTPRRASLLAAIVREYSNTGEPVGSEDISHKYKFQVSSATIRNEMAALERLGYIEQPHTSAGRIPTDLGYRYFVNELMKRFELTLREQQELKKHILELERQHIELGRSIAKLLAKSSDQAAFALLPEDSNATGLANILQHPGTQKSDITDVVEFFDNIDEYADKMLTQFFTERPEALIGSESKLPQIANYSLIVSRVALPSGKKGVIGIIGPKSMRYDKNMSLVEYVAKLLSSGALLVLIIQSIERTI
jgi:transcriptional regulator of heat shock response